MMREFTEGEDLMASKLMKGCTDTLKSKIRK